MNNSRKNIIVYIGEDPTFVKDMRTRFEKNGLMVDYFQKSFSQGTLVEVAEAILPNVIILEISQSSKKEINNEILFLKKMPRYKSIMLIGILSDRETLDTYSTVVSCGISFLYINGSEYDHLYRDCLLYGLEQNIMLPPFAKAGNLKIKKKINAVSSVCAMNPTELYLDSDLRLISGNSLNLSLNLLNDNQIRTFEIAEHNSFSIMYPMMESYVLHYPFAGPWDELSSENIPQNSINEFIESYQQEFDSCSEFVWLYSLIPWAPKLFTYSLTSSLIIEVKSFENIKEQGDLKWKKPRVIIIEATQDKELDQVNITEIIESVKRVEHYNPIIFILNTTDTTDSIKLRNNYGNIITSSKPFEFDFFTKVLNTISKKEFHAKDLHYFKAHDLKRTLRLELDIIILSITEHEIEFELGSEVPLFSIFELELPERIFVTVVDVRGKGDSKFIYLGILHGMDELAYQYLRKIVYQLIFSPRTELTPQEMKRIISSQPVKEVQAVPKVVAEPKVQEKVVNEKKNVTERNLSRSVKHARSKL